MDSILDYHSLLNQKTVIVFSSIGDSGEGVILSSNCGHDPDTELILLHYIVEIFQQHLKRLEKVMPEA